MPATRLAQMTTFRIGGTADALVEAPTEAEFIDAIAQADAKAVPLFVLGGGSNVLVADEGFPGVVVRDKRHDITRSGDANDANTVTVTATAGTTWDDFVAWSIEQGLSGLEALSGIPGTVGAAPVQNIGAYGHDVADTLCSIRAYDRATGAVVDMDAEALELSYRDSVIKRSMREADEAGTIWGPTGRYVVLAASFTLEESTQSAPILYRELAAQLGVERGERADARAVRHTVLQLRASKGMVLDPSDHDTWSAGSFFTNPVLPEAQAENLPEDAPRFPAGEGYVKTSAAWLIDHAGFHKGFAVPGARSTGAALSTKHVLALTNRGQATAAEVVELARAVRRGVKESFGVELVPEPVAVGIEW